MLSQEERLKKVKQALGIGGSFQDGALQIYINEAIDFLVDSGVYRAVAESETAIGAIVLYVNDIYNYASGDVKLSDAFQKRLIQLSSKR